METFEHSHNWVFENGFFPSQPKNGRGVIPGTVYAGQNWWKKGKDWVADKGTSSVGSSGGANPMMLVGGVHGGMTAGGTVTLHSNTTWFIGGGNAIVNGSSIGAGSSFLQLMVSGSPVQAGLAKPTAPTFTVSGTASSKFNGSYSIVAIPFRQTTGAIGNRSNPSALISTKNKKGAVALPAPVTGQTHWILAGSRKGFGSVGPWFIITSLAPIPVATTSVEIDYWDGELGDLAPITNDPPPAGTHCAALGAVMCTIGTYGGYGISPSKPGQPEACDVSQTSFLASPETVTAVTGRGTDGGVFVATRNSISIIILSGSEITPVLPRGVFENVGVAHGNAMCWAHDTLYLFSSTGAACRTQGSQEPDYSFALPVQKYFLDNGFTGSNTIVVFDERNNAVLFCSGNKAVPYMLSTGEWSTPIILHGNVSAGVALDGRALLAISSTLYTLDSGGGNPSGGAFLQSPFEGADGKLLTAYEFYGSASSAVTMDVIKMNRDRTTATLGGKFPYAHPGGLGKVQKPNRKYRYASFKVSATIGGTEFGEAMLRSTGEPGRH